MTFCCPIHGYYHPTPGTTLALCPECASVPATGGNPNSEVADLRRELDRLRSTLATQTKAIEDTIRWLLSHREDETIPAQQGYAVADRLDSILREQS